MTGFRVEDRDHTRWIILDRPNRRNALIPPMLAGMTAAVSSAHTDGQRAIALSGEEGAFCAGADLRWAAEQGPEFFNNLDDHLARYQKLVRALVDSPLPTLAVLDGAAFGFGADLALACDLRVASDRAYFQEGFVRIGLLPDGGGTWMLPRLVGLSKALELALLGERLPAEEARRIGLVTRVVRTEALQGTAADILRSLALGPPLALGHIKRLMRAGLSRPFDEALAAEGMAQLECLRSADCAEGIVAFFGKRPARFEGR